MMKSIIEEILEKYEKMGVKLWVENNELRFKAPINVLNEERKKELRKYKEDIIEYLKENVAEVKHDEKNRYEVFPLTDIQSAYLIGVIRQIKRCRFHQIKTGLSEHLTMG